MPVSEDETVTQMAASDDGVKQQEAPVDKAEPPSVRPLLLKHPSSSGRRVQVLYLVLPAPAVRMRMQAN